MFQIDRIFVSMRKNSAEEREPFFSIITASLNNGTTIEKTILSIKHQTFHSFEHIIIDGGSTDATLAIIKKYQNDYSLSYISEKDSGIADACNKGVRIAKGMYIVIIHADDRLTSDGVLEQVFKNIEQKSALLYSYPVLMEGKDGRLTEYHAKRWKWTYRFKMFFPHQGCYVHRDVFKSVGLFNTSLKIAFDFDFILRCLKVKVPYAINRYFFVAVMLEGGVSNTSGYLKKRVLEEFSVQRMNQDTLTYYIINPVYQLLYYFYKIKLGTLLRTRSSTNIGCSI
jgi:glycosyltransferase involved in cell wall biosynthesis